MAFLVESNLVLFKSRENNPGQIIKPGYIS